MINWTVDEKAFKKTSPKEYKLWRLTQLINFGLEGEKLSEKDVKKAWPKIKDKIDPDKQKVIEFYLWHKKWRREPGLLPDRSNFWTWYFRKTISSKTSI